jgi:HD superfamily phosphodiesterase
MSEFIAREESISENDIDLIKTAALYHDLGFIKGPVNHEEESIRIAREELPGFGYSPEEIDIISGMIKATEIPQTPKNKLEDILADADLEYLGTAEFQKLGDHLLEELLHFHPKLTREKWNIMQIAFLQNHQYHTNFCKTHRLPVKLKNLAQLVEESTK